jgi:hypothetical protein
MAQQRFCKPLKIVRFYPPALIKGVKMGWEAIFDIISKLLPSRKAQLVKKLDELNAKYQKALIEGKDTEAALIRKQMNQLRTQAGLSNGEV